MDSVASILASNFLSASDKTLLFSMGLLGVNEQGRLGLTDAGQKRIDAVQSEQSTSVKASPC